MLVKDQAICIRPIDYSETSQIVTFFTEAHGKIPAIAKGSRRPKSSFGGTLEVFAYGPIVYAESTQGGINTLREFEPRHDVVHGLSRQMTAYHCGLLAMELLNKLTHEYDPHPALFCSSLAFLRQAGGGTGMTPGQGAFPSRRDLLGYLLQFQMALLTEVGLALQTEACANCQQGIEAASSGGFFSSQANGLICRDCEVSFPDRVSLTTPVLRCLADIATVGQAEEATAHEAVSILVDHLSQLLHKRPRTAKYVLCQ